jgi:hypothetical protein
MCGGPPARYERTRPGLETTTLLDQRHRAMGEGSHRRIFGDSLFKVCEDTLA